MVAHPGAALGARTLRPLNTPRPVGVRADAGGRPRLVRRPGWPRPRAVARIQDCWRIDDEWWRDHPIARRYYTVVLGDDRLLTLYHDLIANAWLEQKS